MTTPRAQEIERIDAGGDAWDDDAQPIAVTPIATPPRLHVGAATVWAADPTFTAQRYHHVRREQTADGPYVLAAVAWCGYRPRISAWRPYLARGGETEPERGQQCPVCAGTPPARGSRPGVCGAR